MNLSKEKIEQSLEHGINLLSNKIDGAVIPYDDNVFVLKQFLVALASGQLAVQSVVQKEPGKPAAEPPKPNRQTRRKAAAKKRSKKKS